MGGGEIMRDIFERCIRLDTYAQETYERLAATCDGELCSTLQTLAHEESVHVEWWEELLHAWEMGLLPDIINDSSEIVADLERRYEDIRDLVPDDLAGITDRDVLVLAARLEFFMLFPAFGELIDLIEPGRAHHHHAAYRCHIDHLTQAIGKFAGDDPIVGFLADVLERVSEDNRRLSSHATRDGLTGLHNRRSLDGYLRQWIAWSSRYGRPLAVLLVDVDRFKALNDAYGHKAGDRALVSVAHTLAADVRGSDLVARYGGDEFVVLAPETDARETCILSSRLVESVRALEVDIDQGSINVTVSVGSVVVTPQTDPPATCESVLSAADRSLYAAKKSGRDRSGETRSPEV